MVWYTFSMSKVSYINTQEIRRDLMGFLRELAAGREYVVLNRSKPVVTLVGKDSKNARHDAHRSIAELLAISDTIQAAGKGKAKQSNLDPNKSYKQLYTETMGKKYGIS